MSRPALAIVVIASLFVGLIGFCWLREPPSNQELLANYAKVADYAHAARSMTGIPWWTPNYLQGCSLTFLSLGALTNLALYAGSLVAGPYSGTKLVALGFLFLCPLTMFCFVRRLCPASGWTAFSCGAAYLFAPPILLRLGHVEHVANVLAFAMIPTAFWGVLVFFEKETLARRSFAQSRIPCSCCPMLRLPSSSSLSCWHLHYGYGVFVRNSPLRQGGKLFSSRHFLCAQRAAEPPLASGEPLYSDVRLRPLCWLAEGFSMESALSWVDRSNFLSRSPASSQSEVSTNSSYLGIVGVACVAGLFFFRRRAVWRTSQAKLFRLFVALTLFAHWLGLGANTALSGQFAFLSHANSAWDPAIAISWGLLRCRVRPSGYSWKSSFWRGLG